MRTLFLACALITGFALSTSAFAQSALEGPLAAPDATPAKDKPAKAKSKRHKAKTAAHHDRAEPVEATGSATQIPQPTAHARRDAPADPVSLGMKWNGNNDSARETRVQNYDGSAAGTGGAVGLNFHF